MITQRGRVASRTELSRQVRQGLARARRAGIRLGRPPTEIDAATVHRLLKKGLSVRAIARRLDLPKSTLADWLKRERG